MNYTKTLLSICIAGIGLQPLQSNGMIKKAGIAAGTLGAVALGAAAYKTVDTLYINPIHWNWKNIDATKIGNFPIGQFLHLHAEHLANLQENRTPAQNKFLLGAGTSAHQVESGNTNTQWNLFEAKEKDKDGNWIAPIINGKPALLEGKIVEPVGIGCDAQNHEDEDIQNLVNMGFNAYRFSVAWEKIYPVPNRIDHAELTRYKNFCKKLRAAGIEPVVTLYHYAEPQWFYNMGGFEKAENIKYFVEFCTTVFNELQQDVYLWLTFNAPESIALTGWLTGAKPPAKTDMELALEVLYNVLEAHTAVYRELKKLPGGQESRIGILKNILQLDPWNPLDPRCLINAYFGQEIQNEVTYRYLTTGEFYVKIPRGVNKTKIFGVNVPTSIRFATAPRTNEYIKNGGKCLDFIGLNYYCHNYMTKDRQVVREQNPDVEIPQANPRYTIYGEGLYRAIKEISDSIAQPLDIPIYITENGIGTDNYAHRTLHNQRYLYAMAKAIHDGFDVRGYIHWSLIDNYEWGQYKSHYGIYNVDRTTPELKRSPKDGSKYFKRVADAAQLRAKL